MTDFASMNLTPHIQNALRKAGYRHPTPIQLQAIPPLLDGRDLLGIAQTGTGKTAAFALPILNRLSQHPGRRGPRSARVLVLTPTRELATQIDTSFATYGASLRLARAVIFGGVGQQPQVRAMSQGVDILTATPGRLLDLINQGYVRLDQLETFVLDEADRMLDMGFINDIRKIIAMLPARRQTLLFSATMPQNISALAEGLLENPVRAEVTPQATTVESIAQQVLFVDRNNKLSLLRTILSGPEVLRALVFTRTKHVANRITEELEAAGLVAVAIHSNKSQSAREHALAAFRNGHARILVATDIAARGLDIKDVTHVINYDLPNEPESYVHRIGRTARAGRDGRALSFCNADERSFLRDIERTIRMTIPVRLDHPYHSDAAMQGLGGSTAHIFARPQQTRRPVRTAPPRAAAGSAVRAPATNSRTPARGNMGQSAKPRNTSRSS